MRRNASDSRPDASFIAETIGESQPPPGPVSVTSRQPGEASASTKCGKGTEKPGDPELAKLAQVWPNLPPVARKAILDLAVSLAPDVVPQGQE